jgi:3-methylfumaryl-CoA hydratase
VRHSQVGRDGHPERGDFLPPVPLPRRMWAGGRMRWHAPVHIGDALTRHSRIVSVAHKTGRSGELVFVVVRHEIHTDGGLALTEEHDIVYRASPGTAGEAAPASAPATSTAAWQRTVVPDPVLLFRYSALTFNGHRIHYDRSYATQVEGYPGLVVHGPLLATLLVDLLRRERPDAALLGFDFRALRPVFDTAPFTLCGEPGAQSGRVELWVRDCEGALAMQAHATFD